MTSWVPVAPGAVPVNIQFSAALDLECWTTSHSSPEAQLQQTQLQEAEPQRETTPKTGLSHLQLPVQNQHVGGTVLSTPCLLHLPSPGCVALGKRLQVGAGCTVSCGQGRQTLFFPPAFYPGCADWLYDVLCALPLHLIPRSFFYGFSFILPLNPKCSHPCWPICLLINPFHFQIMVLTWHLQKVTVFVLPEIYIAHSFVFLLCKPFKAEVIS